MGITRKRRSVHCFNLQPTFAAHICCRKALKSDETKVTTGYCDELRTNERTFQYNPSLSADSSSARQSGRELRGVRTVRRHAPCAQTNRHPHQPHARQGLRRLEWRCACTVWLFLDLLHELTHAMRRRCFGFLCLCKRHLEDSSGFFFCFALSATFLCLQVLITCSRCRPK